jgi:hypothetical protein
MRWFGIGLNDLPLQEAIDVPASGTFDTMQAALARMKYTDVKINFRLTTN